MGQYCITKQMIAAFEERLVEEEKSGATIKKRRPGVMLLQCIQYGCTEFSMFHRFITILS